LHENVSLETINEGYPIKREAFKFLRSESFYSLYPNLFVHYNIHSDINDFQFKTLLWSKSSLMQNDVKVSYKNEGNVGIQYNLFQDYEEENNIFMNIVYETLACFFSSSSVIGNVDLVCKLERDRIFYHVVLDIDNTKALHRKMMVISRSHVINSKFECGRENEVIYYMVMSNSHFVSFQFKNNDIYLKKTFLTKSLSQFTDPGPDKICILH